MAQGRKTGGGSRKGIPNKATQDVRAAMSVIAESNVNEFQEWLDTVAKDDPAKAADLYLRALEYHIPKLARTEINGEIGIRGRLVISD